jgi:hypothetical protein
LSAKRLHAAEHLQRLVAALVLGGERASWSAGKYACGSTPSRALEGARARSRDCAGGTKGSACATEAHAMSVVAVGPVAGGERSSSRAAIGCRREKASSAKHVAVEGAEASTVA